MSKLHLHKSFLRQFHEDPVVSPTPEKFRYQHLNYRSFNGKHREVRLLYRSLSGRLNDEQIVQRLMEKLTKEVVPHAKKMSGCARQLFQIFTVYSDLQPYSACYYSTLLSELKIFTALTEHFKSRMQNHLIGFLENISSETTLKEESTACYTEDIRSLRHLTKVSLNQIEDIYDRIDLIVGKESQNEKAVTVASRIGEFLRHLLSLTENLIFSTRDTLNLLGKWEKRMLKREMQEIYN